MGTLKLRSASFALRLATLCIALLAGSTVQAGSAASEPIDKSVFTLFNPTPSNAMREMSSDRPDVTEGPITVDAGHFQVELSLFEIAIDRVGGESTDSLSIVPANIRVGLLNNLELDLVVSPYVNVRTHDSERTFKTQGLGDTEIRLKWNLWGNDGPSPVFGDTAFGILPFVKLPTGSGDLSNHHVEGGLILPLAVSLPQNFDLGVMAEFDLTYNEATGGYGVEFVHSVTLGHEMPGVKDLSAYIEYVGISPRQTGSTYRAIASLGLTYKLNESWIVDVGSTIGLSNAADDFTIFLGLSIRL